ncbi:hypothetical protein COS46_00335 [Candidatus Jorgensenbacteria bacterium CG03_land_8_20_14_0_80_38_39]|nr:MAG: hypothetical protein COS46_00335 [Candidatus Jorgensenbacteria bacterium CG03_land_8_20_14_0_80_38_39]
MNEFRFLKWDVYRNTKKVVKEIFGITGSLAPGFKFNLGDQLNRSVISIALNTAEGSGKGSDHELARFFDIAIGSTHETIAALDLTRDNKLISDKEFQGLTEDLMSIGHQLEGFKRKLKRRQSCL